MLTDSQWDTLKRHLDAENAHRMEDTLATLTEDCVFEDRTLGRTFHGREGARQYYELWWNAFGVSVHTEQRHVCDDGLLVVETRFRGTHEGEFLGLAPTRRDVDLPLAILVTMSGDLLGGERFYWDAATLLVQLGTDSIPPSLTRGRTP